jgi:hypothetical protein
MNKSIYAKILVILASLGYLAFSGLSAHAGTPSQVVCTVYVGSSVLVAQGTVTDVESRNKGDKTQGELKNPSMDAIITNIDVNKMEMTVEKNFPIKGKHVETKTVVTATLADGKKVELSLGERNSGTDTDEKQVELKDGRLVVISARQECSK